MPTKYGKLLKRPIAVTTIVMGLSLAVTGVSITQTAAQPAAAITQCANDPTVKWLIGTVTNPSPADAMEIMTLIHRYHWALDDGDPVQLTGLFVDQAFFELCRPSNELVSKSTGRDKVEEYLNDHFEDLDAHKSKTRHIESNTILNVFDPNTVQGKSTVVVTLQHGNIETPVLDYTAELRTEFKKDNNVWKFSKLTLIPDEPKITLRAR